MQFQNITLLTAVFVEDKNHGAYTAWFVEVPGVIAEGETIDEAEENLYKILPMYIVDSEKYTDSNDETELGKVIRRTYKY